MIPKLRNNGTLPPGQHPATWNEVTIAFGGTPWRQNFIPGLERMCRHLRDAGADHVWLNGSFTTKDPFPLDYDLCYPAKQTDADKLDECIKKIDREAMKKAYLGEAYADDQPSIVPGLTLLGLFQLIRGTTIRKGIVLLDLGSLP